MLFVIRVLSLFYSIVMISWAIPLKNLQDKKKYIILYNKELYIKLSKLYFNAELNLNESEFICGVNFYLLTQTRKVIIRNVF